MTNDEITMLVNKDNLLDEFYVPQNLILIDHNENIIWLVYRNKNFNSCCSKVINITEEQLEILHLNQNEKGRSM